MRIGKRKLSEFRSYGNSCTARKALQHLVWRCRPILSKVNRVGISSTLCSSISASWEESLCIISQRTLGVRNLSNAPPRETSTSCCGPSILASTKTIPRGNARRRCLIMVRAFWRSLSWIWLTRSLWVAVVQCTYGHRTVVMAPRIKVPLCAAFPKFLRWIGNPARNA